jgi:hypothetical protein
MALIRLNNQSLSSVTTLPAADGSNLTGISAGGFQFIKKVTISTTSAVQDFTNLFSADYNHYKLIWDMVGDDTSDSDTSHSFQFLKASDGAVDSTADIDFVMNAGDSDATTTRSTGKHNKDYFNFLYNTSEDGTPAFYEMTVSFAFQAKYTMVTCLHTYMVNNATNVITANGAAMRANTTSYSGMRLVLVNDNTTSTADVSCSTTGTLRLYGIAEA